MTYKPQGTHKKYIHEVRKPDGTLERRVSYSRFAEGDVLVDDAVVVRCLTP